MDNGTPVVEAQVQEVEENDKKQNISSSVEVINAQKIDFQKKLEIVRKNLATYQQAFEAEKQKGIKLEGAIESLDLLLKSLQK